MKKLIFGLLFAFAICACESATDLTEVNDRLDSLEQRMSAAEALLKANESGLYIVSVQQTTDGYVFFMSDGSQVAVYNGKDGQNGSNGSAGSSLVKSIAVGDMEVTFTLTDGRTFSIPLYSALSITFDKADLALIPDYSERNIHYTVQSNLTGNITVEVVTSADILAEVVKESATTGYININTTTVTKYSRVLVFVSNGEKTITKSVPLDGTVDDDDDNEDDDNQNGHPTDFQAQLMATASAEIVELGETFTIDVVSNTDWWFEITRNEQLVADISNHNDTGNETITITVISNPDEIEYDNYTYTPGDAIVFEFYAIGYIRGLQYMVQRTVTVKVGPGEEDIEHAGTLEDPLSVANAIKKAVAAGSNKEDAVGPYYIKGVITALPKAENNRFGSSYGNGGFVMSDEFVANEFTAYRIYYLGNKKWTEGDTLPEVGDKVVIYATIFNYMGNTPETNSGYLYSLNGVTAGEDGNTDR